MSLSNAFYCPNPVALVTGSVALRVGRAIVMRLVASDCRLAIHVRTSEDDGPKVVHELRDQGCDAMLVRGDMADSPSEEEMVTKVISHFGRLDILVNSAAIWNPIRLEASNGSGEGYTLNR